MASPYETYIASRAKQLGLDPAAVLAVASHEGGLTLAPGHYDPDTLGHPGWSYGPFQLRSPGKLPISSSGPSGPGERFAWSKAGIDYALQGIAKVAGGLKGGEAVTNIVTRFENPADPGSEIDRANRSYLSFSHYNTPGLGGPSLIPLPLIPELAGLGAGAEAGGAGIGAGAAGGAGGLLGKLASDAGAALKAGKDAALVGFLALLFAWAKDNTIRLVELVGGAALIFVSLRLLAGGG